MECSYLPEERASTMEDIQRIQDLESRVKNLKNQVITALDKAEKSAKLEAKVSLLET
jgi:hypothetical protein